MAEAEAILIRVCGIEPTRTPTDVQNVVGALWRAYDLTSNPGSMQDSSYEILGHALTKEFAPNRDTRYYVNPFLAAPDPSFPQYLSREDVIALLESIAQYIMSAARRGDITNLDILSLPQRDVLKKLEAGLGGQHNNKEQLKQFIIDVYSIFTTLEAPEDDDEEKPAEVEKGLFPELKQLLVSESSVDAAWIIRSWDYVKVIAKDAAEAPVNGLTQIQTEIDKQPVLFQVILLRFFLNDWFKLLYSDTTKNIFARKNIVLPTPPHFSTTQTFFLNVDREDWVKEDREVAVFITKELAELINEYLRLPEPNTPPAYATDSTEDAESESEVTKDKKEEDLDNLILQFEQAGYSYSREAERLTEALLPHFFHAHGFPLDTSGGLSILRQYDELSFGLVWREFRVELENVLRSLSPDEFMLLQSGNHAGFRMNVLRKLYAKLGTNPRFVGALQRYKDQYVETLQAQLEATSSEKEKARISNELDRLDKQSNLGDIHFDKIVEKAERAPTETWAADLKKYAKPGHVPLESLSHLGSITQADLKKLLKHLTKSELDYDALVRNLDIVIAERWSPEQLRGLYYKDVSVILGVTLPEEFALNRTSYERFLSVLVQYLYVRRQRLADHYELDAISREDGKLVEGDQRDAAPTEEQKKKFLESKELLEATEKELGHNSKKIDKTAGEALILARASDGSRVKEYKSGGHSMAKTISTLHTKTKGKRAEQFTKEEQALRNEFLAAGSIEKKIKFLQSLGYVIPELDGETGVETTVTAQEALVQQRFDDAMADRAREHTQDLDSLSYFEDLDDGVVEDQKGSAGIPPGQNGYRPAGAQRYGRPGKARSLARGALDVRKKLNQSKKAGKAIKDAAKRVQKLAKKALDTATELLPISKKKLAGIGILGGLGLLRMYHLWSTGGLFTQIGGVVGGIGGGIAGFFGFGPAGAAAGAFGGAWGGMELGYQLDSTLGLTKATGLAEPLGTGGGGALPSLGTQSPAASAANAANPVNAAVATTSSQSSGVVLTPGGALTVAATGGYTMVMLMGSGGILGAIQPPPLGTIGTDGMESPYVVMEKIATTPQGTALTGDVPAEVRYQLFIESRDDFQIEITGFTDVFSVTANSEARGTSTVPTLDPSACPDLSFDALKANLVAAGAAEGTNPLVGVDGVLQPGEVSDGRLFIGECTLNFDESFDHTGVQNIFSITFNAIGGSGKFDNQTAETTELVCFGDCPQQSEGDWPTTGYFSQGPFGFGLSDPNASHRKYSSDALDIGNRSVQNGELIKVFATYGGTAYFFDGNAATPTTLGVDTNYGWHIVLRTDQGFTLIYAHLLAESFQGVSPGESIRVEACQLMGYMGSTGNSTGPHLHYEYRVSGRGWYSFPTGGRELLMGIIPSSYKDPQNQLRLNPNLISPQNCR